MEHLDNLIKKKLRGFHGKTLREIKVKRHKFDDGDAYDVITFIFTDNQKFKVLCSNGSVYGTVSFHF